MADAAVSEYRGMSEAEKKAYRRYKDALFVSTDFCRPYFDKFTRMIDLYRGKFPDEVSGTWSKVWLHIPFSIVQNELPRRASMMLSEGDFFRLHAGTPELEFSADDASMWLQDQCQRLNHLFPRIMPTLTQQCIVGTGYRVVSFGPIRNRSNSKQKVPATLYADRPASFREEAPPEHYGIVPQHVDCFSILPSPMGGIVNAYDNDIEGCAEWVHWIDYMTKEKLQGMMGKPGVNDTALRAMFSSVQSSHGSDFDAIDAEYREKASAYGDGGTETNKGLPKWVDDIRQKYPNLTNRYRCVWTFFRDQWILTAEDKYVVYAGPPLLDWIPIAKYVDTPSFDEWFGVGMLETVEDIVLAYELNYNFRMDYLATTLHPTKFIRDDIVKQNPDGSDFDPSPYGMFKFPRRVDDIRRAVWYDRFPEISPQAFMEETGFRQLLQEITAQPNYMKGQGGGTTLANETATGIVNLIEEGSARSSFRAINTEYSGLHDELKLILMWGKKMVWNDQTIRLTGKQIEGGGWPWRKISWNAIDDEYDIEMRGTRNLLHKTEVIKRMLSLLPLLVNNPNVPGQKEMLSQAMKEANVFTDVEKILAGSPEQQASPVGLLGPGAGTAENAGTEAMMGMGAGAGGGMGAGTPTMQNEATSVMNRTGAPAPMRMTA